MQEQAVSDKLLSCPLCASTNISDGVCWIGERNLSKEPAVRCVDCGCRATKAAWSRREQLTTAQAAYLQFTQASDAKLAKATAALEEILTANDQFRAGMPKDWEGDLLQDACEQARSFLKEMRS